MTSNTPEELASRFSLYAASLCDALEGRHWSRKQRGLALKGIEQALEYARLSILAIVEPEQGDLPELVREAKLLAGEVEAVWRRLDVVANQILSAEENA